MGMALGTIESRFLLYPENHPAVPAFALLPVFDMVKSPAVGTSRIKRRRNNSGIPNPTRARITRDHLPWPDLREFPRYHMRETLLQLFDSSSLGISFISRLIYLSNKDASIVTSSMSFLWRVTLLSPQLVS